MNRDKLFRALDTFFSEEELKTLCFQLQIDDESISGDNKQAKARELIKYCERFSRSEDLVAEIEKQRPHILSKVELTDKHPKSKNNTNTTVVQPVNALHLIGDNDLGRGILLGGIYKTVSLSLVAAYWGQMGDTVVTSGWLYSPLNSYSHSIAFFKLHVYETGRAYMHIADVSSPTHKIWLKTNTNFQFEQDFHYLEHPNALWQFYWK